MSGRRAGQRFDAAHGVTTEALVFLGELDPEAIGPALEHATHYEPTPVADAEALLDASPIAPHGATFVDLGAGMGRVALLAARRPFRAVIGVEVSPALVEIARDNLTALRDPDRRVRDVKFVVHDAATYAFPRGDLVIYLYNPFRAPVLRAVLANLRAAGEPRSAALLYHTPLERETIDRDGGFTLVRDLGFGLVYCGRTPETVAPTGGSVSSAARTVPFANTSGSPKRARNSLYPAMSGRNAWSKSQGRAFAPCTIDGCPGAHHSRVDRRKGSGCFTYGPSGESATATPIPYCAVEKSLPE
ncbi:MAG TPA: class I SAM-dependent methyltransferase [Candidatus Baltobacteraceae bacterium]|nr:class I SAM-dependent methyltransferase [Candidatus Baltobacteraceae bacterium]